MAGKSFVVPCPCCQAKLTIDAELGAVIAHEEPPRQRSTADLGTAIDQLASKSREREERFRQQMAALVAVQPLAVHDLVPDLVEHRPQLYTCTTL